MLVLPGTRTVRGVGGAAVATAETEGAFKGADAVAEGFVFGFEKVEFGFGGLMVGGGGRGHGGGAAVRQGRGRRVRGERSAGVGGGGGDRYVGLFA